MSFHPVMPENQIETVKKVSISDLELDEINIGIDMGFNMANDRLFSIEQAETRLLYNNKDYMNSVVYEMTPLLNTINRAEYGFFNFIADVGGLFGAVYATFSGLTVLLTLDGPQSLVAAELLKTNDTNDATRNMTASV